MMKNIGIVLLFASFWASSFGQINEAGIFAGGSNYIGDIGRTNYIYPNSYAVGLIYKWNMHPHYSLRANYTYSRLTANDNSSDNSYRKYRGAEFANDIHELVAGIEYHFFKYNLSRTGHTNTPYLFAEIGAVNYATLSGRTFNFAMPFGAGYKTILAPGIGIGFELGFRYTFKDDIDGYPTYTFGPNGEPYESGIPYDVNGNVEINANNDDWYVFTGITLVFAFGREGCYTGSF